MNTKKAALVLSGGGALGAAHIGVLKVLEERGYTFDYLAAVSAGSIIAALAACGKSSGEIKQILDQVSFFSLAFDFRKAQFALLRGDKVKSLVDSALGEITFADVPVRLLIGATDFSTGERVALSSGRIADAVRASISVPVVFEPFFHPGERRWLVDGGLSQNLPLDWALRDYLGDTIFAVDVATSFATDTGFGSTQRKGRAKNMLDTAQRTLHIVLLNQQAHIPHDPRVTAIRPHLEEYSAVDVFKLDEIRLRGEEAAARALDAANR
jgi:NTE family protein